MRTFRCCKARAAPPRRAAPPMNCGAIAGKTYAGPTSDAGGTCDAGATKSFSYSGTRTGDGRPAQLSFTVSGTSVTAGKPLRHRRLRDQHSPHDDQRLVHRRAERELGIAVGQHQRDLDRRRFGVRHAVDRRGWLPHERLADHPHGRRQGGAAADHQRRRALRVLAERGSLHAAFRHLRNHARPTPGAARSARCAPSWPRAARPSPTSPPCRATATRRYRTAWAIRAARSPGTRSPASATAPGFDEVRARRQATSRRRRRRWAWAIRQSPAAGDACAVHATNLATRFRSCARTWTAMPEASENEFDDSAGTQSQVQILPPAQRPPVSPEALAHRDLRSGPFWQRLPAYAGVSEAEFLDHQWQAKNSITTFPRLLAALEGLVSSAFIQDAEQGFRHAPMPVRVSPYLMSLIDWSESRGRSRCASSSSRSCRAACPTIPRSISIRCTSARTCRCPGFPTATRTRFSSCRWPPARSTAASARAATRSGSTPRRCTS